ncbi:hypothetical protein B0H34DRAFT_800166 [Crassisporium funariophilum]|nr:hypothetical protein B0H34DRAFT_800166 [Crassisporium funariophilum]
MPRASKDKENGTRSSWNSSSDSILVSCLKKQKADGRMTSNSSWHSAAWVEAEKDLAGSEKTSGGGKKTAASCQYHWAALKKEYVQVKQLRDKSGSGWDEGLCRVTATDEVWDALLKSNPKLAKWRKAAFPLYEDMHELVVGTVATGEGAFRPGRDFTPVTEAGENGDDAASRRLPSAQGDGSDTEELGDESSCCYTHPTPLGPVTPWRANSNGQKCAADDSFESVLSSKKTRGRKPTAGHAITNVASSVQELATTFVGSMGSNATPERKTAIQMLEVDGNLSENEKIGAIQLFRKDSSIAQSYLAIKMKETRTRYIQFELETAAA